MYRVLSHQYVKPYETYLLLQKVAITTKFQQLWILKYDFIIMSMSFCADIYSRSIQFVGTLNAIVTDTFMIFTTWTSGNWYLWCYIRFNIVVPLFTFLYFTLCHDLPNTFYFRKYALLLETIKQISHIEWAEKEILRHWKRKVK